jgi:HSP20 family molecular chaperone IbpA
MLMPSIFGETLLDDFWGFPMRDNYMRTANTNGLMQTDVEEHENAYEITMNLPGFKKEDVKGEIKDGYLTITASTNTNNDEKDKDGKFIRRERYSGTCSRSFYVGEDVTQDEIKAKFVDGVLKVAIPKKEAKPQVEKSNFISIEG